MDRYSHTVRGEERKALDVLPDLTTPPAEPLRKTGTTDSAPNVSASCLSLLGVSGGTNTDSTGRSDDERDKRKTRQFQLEKLKSRVFQRRERDSPLPGRRKCIAEPHLDTSASFASG